MKVFPEKLRSIDVPTIGLHDCQQVYRDHVSPITERNFCTLDQNRIKGSCHGDSGGPFVIDGKLAGVLSWNLGYVGEGFPDVFLKVSFPEYLHWIRATMSHLER